MRLYRNGKSIDVQPKKVGDYERAGWSRREPKPSRRTRRDEQPDEPSGDVSETEGES